MKRSQTEIILAHLKSGHTLTKAQCWEKYKIMNTGARINELRNHGHDIHTTMVVNDEGNEYALYYIPRQKSNIEPVLVGNQYSIPMP